MSKVLVLFADGSEELEAVTIVNILRRGGIAVTLAGLQAGLLRGSRGTLIMPDTTLDDALSHDYDMVVLPGGQPGTNNLKADTRIIKLLQRMAASDRYVCAICAAPSVLAAAGLLDGKHATSFPGSLDAFPKVSR
ncbi:MAG: DJ-1/PfpI family protein, partial [Gallionellaceae bacterium]|nr:DJ-1/PfpI family protein [Gallionellaceae bacterium]